MSFVFFRVTTVITPEPLLNRLGSVTSERMRRVGARIQKNVRGRLQYRTGSSRPGRPPHIHRSRTQQSSPLERSILYGLPDPLSVIVGAANVAGKSGMVARVLEQGGTSIRSDGQEITIEARPFMRPAMHQETMKAPAFWANSL